MVFDLLIIAFTCFPVSVKHDFFFKKRKLII